MAWKHRHNGNRHTVQSKILGLLGALVATWCVLHHGTLPHRCFGLPAVLVAACQVGYPTVAAVQKSSLILGASERGSVSGISEDDDAWKQAFQLELERLELLKAQWESCQADSTGAPVSQNIFDPDDVSSDSWADRYQRLSAENQVLEIAIQELMVTSSQTIIKDMRDVAAEQPARFEVKLPNAGGSESVELARFFGRSAAFYCVTASLPLGLNITKRVSGPLLGAFVIENVLPGGSAEASGKILPGDILQALTIVADSADLGMRTEDFVSSVVGGLGRFRPTLTDATFINTVEELADLIKTNTILGSDTELALIFERNISSAPNPSDILEPLPAI